MIFILIILFVYLFLICPSLRGKNHDAFKGYYYAHRGLFNNIDVPENSIEAFKRAVEKGYGIELDVAFTKDDVLVVFHDASLLRMTGLDKKIWECTYSELQELSLLNTEYKTPTFKEVLEVIDGKVPFILELKMDKVDTKVCALSNEILKNYQGVYCIESFHPFALYWYRKNRPDVIRGQLSQNYLKEEKAEYHTVIHFILGKLLVNVIGRPDFIAYKHQHKHNLARKITRLLGAFQVAWTIQSKEELKENIKDYDLFIFDSCEL